MAFFKRAVIFLLLFEILLSVLHLLLPEYRWGQGRSSYFNFKNTLTLASWLLSMQFAALGGLSLFIFHKDRWKKKSGNGFVWVFMAAVFFLLSLVEMTRFPVRLGWFRPDTFLGSAIQNNFSMFFIGGGVLLGSTLLFLLLGRRAFMGPGEFAAPQAALPRIPVLIGVAGASFTMIFLQVLLFQMLTISSDSLTAQSVLPIALLGVSLGGLLGGRASPASHSNILAVSGLLVPVTILTSLGVVADFRDQPLFASLLLMPPFILCGLLITIPLVRLRPHLVYFIDLVGAGLGALLFGPILGFLGEEGSVLFLAAFSLLSSGFFISALRNKKRALFLFVAASAFGVSAAAVMVQKETGFLNIVLPKIQKNYPDSEILFSKSSFVGRVDIVRRSPSSPVLKTYENGFTIDTIRPDPVEHHRVDPRIPHDLIKNPSILILGVAGDGVTKTAKFLGRKVTGVEINPAMVRLQQNEAALFSAKSYEGIELSLMDARSFLEGSAEKFDIITLLNAHTSRARAHRNSASPEYLHTEEAMLEYLNHLTDRGILSVEEPLDLPKQEPPIWKLLVTMRKAFQKRGVPDPDRHFFVFQWKTRADNYIQVLAKKTPFTLEETKKLVQWLKEVDDIERIETEEGTPMGPIRAKTTVLYSPDGAFETTYARIIRGKTTPEFLKARNLEATTDDRPFHFNVDPEHSAIRDTYVRTLFLALGLIPFLIALALKYRLKPGEILPYLALSGLTGIGYLALELILIQRYQIFLGSPIAVFCAVLGTLLFFSGLGSLWSAGANKEKAAFSMAAALFFLVLHETWVPAFLSGFAAYPLFPKIMLVVLLLAPLAFFLGVPFPYLLSLIKDKISAPAVGMLVAVNAATSALAVPLALNLSAFGGFSAAFQMVIAIYAVVWLLFLFVGKKFGRVAGLLGTGALVLVLASPWIPESAAKAAATPSGYRVYGLSFGSSLPEKQMIWLFWVIRGEGRVILVDTGSGDKKLGRKWRIQNHLPPEKRLARLGIAPEDVTDVILTHAHWDHAGAIRSYPNAKIWIQRKEFEHAKSSLSPNILKGLLAAQSEKRLELLDGQAKPAPGITVTPAGNHTPGSQVVKVETLDGPVILAGDEKVSAENAASPFYVLTSHEPLVMKWFPRISRNIVQITAASEPDA